MNYCDGGKLMSKYEEFVSITSKVSKNLSDKSFVQAYHVLVHSLDTRFKELERAGANSVPFDDILKAFHNANDAGEKLDKSQKK
jgi:hypothetical protein